MPGIGWTRVCPAAGPAGPCSQAIMVVRKRVAALPSAGTVLNQYCLIARQLRIDDTPFRLV